MAAKTRGTAISAKCRQCSYDCHAPGTWREQIAQCSVIACPIWPFRPAPSGGPFANPPRDPENVSREWRRLPVGSAFSALGRANGTDPPCGYAQSPAPPAGQPPEAA
jgi:hypothetical protein